MYHFCYEQPRRPPRSPLGYPLYPSPQRLEDVKHATANSYAVTTADPSRDSRYGKHLRDSHVLGYILAILFFRVKPVWPSAFIYLSDWPQQEVKPTPTHPLQLVYPHV